MEYHKTILPAGKNAGFFVFAYTNTYANDETMSQIITATISALRRFQQRWWMAAADIAGGSILLFFAGLGTFAVLRALAIIR